MLNVRWINPLWRSLRVLPSRRSVTHDELIRGVVVFFENLRPVALASAGGIGNTSIALEVLHGGRIEVRTFSFFPCVVPAMSTLVPPG